jgi:hypothetical protein
MPKNSLALLVHCPGDEQISQTPIFGPRFETRQGHAMNLSQEDNVCSNLGTSAEVPGFAVEAVSH